MEALTPIQQVLVVISGLLVGFILAVPLLLYFVGYDHPHIIIGTTAVAVALIAYANLFTHWRAGTVRWKPAILFAIPGVIGAAVGAQVGKVFPSTPLLFLFALLMIVIALLMLRSGGSSSSRPTRSGSSMLAWIFPIGFGVGLLSGFFGIGGGFLIVPGLIFATGMPLLSAVGSSLFSVGMFGTTTGITYALAGLVNWLIVVEYLAGGIPGGLLGVERFSLGLQDRFLTDTAEARIQVARLIRELRPGFVYSTGEACVHPDHAAVVGLVRAAVFLARLGQWERVPGGELLAKQDPWIVERLFFPHCKMEPPGPILPLPSMSAVHTNASVRLWPPISRSEKEKEKTYVNDLRERPTNAPKAL